MAITPLPPMPSRSDTPANFITKADAFLAALNTFATQVDAVGVGITLVATNSTSTDSLANVLGSQSLTVGISKSYMAGMTVKIAAATSTPIGSVWMLGDVTSYNSSTGALVVNVNVIQGTGTFASWAVFQSAPGGARPGANTDITSLASPALGSATSTTPTLGDASSLVANTEFVEKAIGIGSVASFFTASAPLGYLKADGSSVSRAAYANLFTAIGVMFGSVDGATFNLPDLRGLTLRGLDGGRGLDSGRTLGSYQADQLLIHSHGTSEAAHAHGIADPGHAHGYTAPTAGSGNVLGNGPYYPQASSAAANTTGSGTGIGIYGNTTGLTINNSAGGSETRVKNMAVLLCVKY